MQVENDRANELLIAARKGEKTAEFMDAISGVQGYKLNNLKRQGCIRSIFSKELISDQFLLHFDDIVSVFWRGVYEKLDSAKLFGETVKIKAPGKECTNRPTNNNPIHFLRYHGRMSVRNYITGLYRRNLEQGCDTCGYRVSIRNHKTCPKCSGLMSSVYKFVDSDDHVIASYAPYNDLDNAQMSIKIGRLLQQFADTVLGEGTRAYQILKILVDPAASKDLCKTCRLCSATTFDINVCTNYNANIGTYLNINRTMVANKVSGIRRRFPRWLEENGSEEARYLLSIIPDRFKI